MKRVLIVDDEPDLLEVWSFALEHVGYLVDRAHNGNAALTILAAQLPDLIVTDLMMPGMDGAELCRLVRNNPEWAKVPILLHTSAHVAVTSSLLWNAVLRKPASMDAFLVTIANLTTR
ncbi:Histidine kinase (plasmid) [Pararobbsia alpina]|uniref:response regulator n=1 Tax=Pararobbsia alpina TaxID=621374 RepID=UPI0039A50D37